MGVVEAILNAHFVHTHGAQSTENSSVSEKDVPHENFYVDLYYDGLTYRPLLVFRITKEPSQGLIFVTG